MTFALTLRMSLNHNQKNLKELCAGCSSTSMRWTGGPATTMMPTFTSGINRLSYWLLFHVHLPILTNFSRGQPAQEPCREAYRERYLKNKLSSVKPFRLVLKYRLLESFFWNYRLLALIPYVSCFKVSCLRFHMSKMGIICEHRWNY